MYFFDISWDKKHNKMESHDEKQGRFTSTLKTYVSMLFQIKGMIRKKNMRTFLVFFHETPDKQ